jgi:hypothetical protein
MKVLKRPKYRAGHYGVGCFPAAGDGDLSQVLLNVTVDVWDL